MNMKKTIAAVAACAVAVSAMATTVSAEEGSLNYNLVKKTYTKGGDATFTSTLFGIDTTGAEKIVIKLVADADDGAYLKNMAETEFTISGYNMEANIKTDVFNFNVTGADWKLNYSPWVGVNWGEFGTADGVQVTIPVMPDTSNGVVAGAATYFTVTTKLQHTNTDWLGLNGDINFQLTTYDANGDALATQTMNTTMTAWNSAASTLDKEYPMATTLNGTTGSQEIISYLEKDANNLVKDGLSYANVRAVLNDIISNYDEVTFKFNTATKKVNDKGEYDDNGTIDCTSFGQHLYNLYGDETTGYVYSNSYVFSNLFAGALVVNDRFSMNLSDINTFDYGVNSLSFEWADVADGAVVNEYVTYLHTMRLATSTTWYWDSMDVVFANTESEDVSTDAGTETEDDEILDEEVIDDEVIDDEVIDDEVIDDEVIDDEEPEVVVPEVDNPATGNAPIALAVIPVALAAAAVVAKKRG